MQVFGKEIFTFPEKLQECPLQEFFDILEMEK
jgi:hypothetical protein